MPPLSLLYRQAGLAFTTGVPVVVARNLQSVSDKASDKPKACFRKSFIRNTYDYTFRVPPPPLGPVSRDRKLASLLDF